MAPSKKSYVYLFAGISAVFIAVMLIFVGNGPRQSLVGNWISDDVAGAHWEHQTYIQFLADGTGYVTIDMSHKTVNEKIIYSTDADNLTMHILGSVKQITEDNPILPTKDAPITIHHYKILGDTLTIDTDNGTGLMLTRNSR